MLFHTLQRRDSTGYLLVSGEKHARVLSATSESYLALSSSDRFALLDSYGFIRVSSTAPIRAPYRTRKCYHHHTDKPVHSAASIFTSTSPHSHSLYTVGTWYSLYLGRMLTRPIKSKMSYQQAVRSAAT
jgi:hypothetical protein